MLSGSTLNRAPLQIDSCRAAKTAGPGARLPNLFARTPRPSRVSPISTLGDDVMVMAALVILKLVVMMMAMVTVADIDDGGDDDEANDGHDGGRR